MFYLSGNRPGVMFNRRKTPPITPMDLRPLSLGPIGNGGIIRLQPLTDRFRPLFKGPFQGTLWRKTPCTQVPMYRPERKIHPKDLLDIRARTAAFHGAKPNFIWSGVLSTISVLILSSWAIVSERNSAYVRRTLGFFRLRRAAISSNPVHDS